MQFTHFTPSVEYLPRPGDTFGAPAPVPVDGPDGQVAQTWAIAPAIDDDSVGSLVRSILTQDVVVALAVADDGRAGVSIAPFAHVLAEGEPPEMMNVSRETLALIGRVFLRAAAADELWKED